MKVQLFEVTMADYDGSTYVLTLKNTTAAPVTIRTDKADVVLDLVLEHVHYHYKKIVHEKIKSLMAEPLYIGFIDEYSTPFGKVEIRSSKLGFSNGLTNYEVFVDGKRRFSSAYYHIALARYITEVYSLICVNVSAQITHLITWLGGPEE